MASQGPGPLGPLDGESSRTPAGDARGSAPADPASPATPDGSSGGFTRRRFVYGAGILGGAAALDALGAYARLIPNPLPHPIAGLSPSTLSEIGSLLSDTNPRISFTLRRREDFLFLQVDGFNLRRSGQRLVKGDGSRPSYIVFTFEPQHLAEEAFTGSAKSPGNSKESLAYPSRIAFVVPDGRDIPLTVAGLLDWGRLHPSVSRSASYDDGSSEAGPEAGHNASADHRVDGHRKPKPVHHKPGAPKLAQPTPTETSIELPWRLALSPTPKGRWSHPSQPITSGGFTEAWHTRLADSTAQAATDGGSIRAIWNFDFDSHKKPTLDSSNAPSGNGPFLTSLDPFRRWQIVNLTSNFSFSGRKDVMANKLWLSTRGGYLDSIGYWDSVDTDLGEWKHLATVGRDQYVKTVEKGYLLPFGHKATFVTVTEREFQEVSGETVAAFHQIKYVVVREPLKIYNAEGSYGLANGGRAFPFQSLEITTLRTPDVSTPHFLTGYGSEDPFFPTLASGDPFLWHFVGTDWMGQTAEFTAPALFVFQDQSWEPKWSAQIRDTYNYLKLSDPRRVGTFKGGEVAFAESYTPGDTNHGLHSMAFWAGAGNAPRQGTAKNTDYEKADQPMWYPEMALAEITLSAAAQASGGAPLTNPLVSYVDEFVAGGFNTAINRANLYLAIAEGAPALNFASGSSGGVITPNLSLSGISRSLGPVAGDLSDLLQGKFNPLKIFDNTLNATILGGVKLSTLIAEVTGISTDDPSAQAMKILYNTAGSTGVPSPGVPGLTRHRAEHDAAALELRPAIDPLPGVPGVPTVPPIPTTRTTHFHWEPQINTASDQQIPIVTPIAPPPTTTPAFVLDGVVTTNLKNPAASTFSLTGNLTNFAVSLMSSTTAEFITINFNSLTFTAAKGQKSNVTVDIAEVEFDGPLRFIEQLEEFMDFSGDGGPKITVQPDGVSADLSVALPPIGVGIFSLSNIGVDVGFNLPFVDGPARFRFSFSTQDNPFTLSVAIFGGGGFFGIAIGTDGVELIQASFDFGAMESIDLGVASGSVELVAGIYFSYGQANGTGPETCILTGFVKLDGNLTVVDIINLSLTFDLSLTWEQISSTSSTSGTTEVTGTATLSVSVSVSFFSFSVSVTAQKTFGGGGNQSSVGSVARRNGLRESDTRRLSRSAAHSDGTDTPPTFATQVPNQGTWADYCNAFATN